MDPQTFIRQACFERWGNGVIINQYEKANEKDKKLMLQEYFIPLKKDGSADWKRYHTMRSRFELALKLFTPLRRSELKKDRFRSSWLMITASNDTALRTKHCLLIVQLTCDIGRICLEHREYYHNYISIDKYSLFTDKHTHKNTRTLSAVYIASTDAKLIFKELLGYYRHSKKHEKANHTSVFQLIMALFLEDMAFRGKKDKILDSIKRAVSIYMKKSEQENEFLAWFEHIYLPTCSADLAYEFLFKICRQTGEPSEGLFELLDEEKHLLHSPSHLKRVMDLLLASETNVKIDTKFFTTLAELGAPFEAYMPRCAEKFYHVGEIHRHVTKQSVWLSVYDSTLCANAINYLEFVLLKHYPAEAQRVVIDMIEQGKPVLFWILGDSFNLVRQSLGDRWKEFRFRVVDMMLELYPLEVRTMTLNIGQDSVLTGVTLDTVQVKCLNLLMTLPKLYPDETQRQILNVAMSQLYNNETNKTELQTKILKMPYMQQPINDNTLPYYIALQALSPNLAISDSLLDDITMKFVDKYFSA